MKRLFEHKRKITPIVFLCLLLIVPLFYSVALSAAETDEAEIDHGIPVIYLNIDEQQGTIYDMINCVDHDVYCYGTIRIDVPEGFHYSDMPDAVCQSVDGLTMSIRGRGNSTWSRSPKKPFKIKLNKKADLFGLGENKHWVLVANYFDATLIRDRITAWLGDRLGFEFTPRGVPVDLVMTGQEFGTEYLGSYYFSENVRVDKNRLNIDELKEEDKDMPSISGGYLLQNATQVRQGSPDRFYTSRGVDWATHTPSFDTEENTGNSQESENESLTAGTEECYESPDLGDAYENPTQQEYIQNHIQKIEDLLYGEDLSGEGFTDYKDLMDVESAASYWLVNQISLNGDAYATGSTYIYKKRDTEQGIGKLYWGPLWDFDFAWNNRPETTGFDIRHEWIQAMLYDKSQGGFLWEIKKQWPETKAAVEELIADGGIIDQYYEETKASAIVDRPIYRPSDTGFDYEAEVNDLKKWIRDRLSWLEDHFEELDHIVHKVDFIVDGKIYSRFFGTDSHFVYGTEEYPVKEGYVFLGWADEEGNIIKSPIPIKEDMTITARYILEEEASHGEDIVFQKCSDLVRYNHNARRYQIEYTVIPTDAQYRAVDWSSSDEEFATVDEEGIVTFTGPGQVTLTARLKYGGSRDFTLTIIGQDEEFPVPESIRPEQERIEMVVGTQSPFSILTDPSPAKIDDYTYYSDDEAIVAIDSSGVLTALSPGQTRVHVTATSYGSREDRSYETYTTVIVSEAGPDPEPGPDTDKISIRDAIVTGNETKTYTGSAIKPPVKVRLGDKSLKAGKDYKLTYSKNKNVGTAVITIKGIGDYDGTKTVTFTIRPKPTKIKSLKPLKKGFKVSWKKITKQVSGYQLRWSLKSNMAGAQYKSVKSARKTTFRKTRLKGGKKYYVQIRTYKTVNGKKYYSRWSGKKKTRGKR